MRFVRPLVAIILAVVVLTIPSVVQADGRVALVVGNGTYAHIGRLPNTENDAVDISAALRRLGFEVTTELDADRVELTEALRLFTRQSAGADVSLVFYAGHGIEMDGVNYLVPVDARLERDVDVRFETVTVDDLLVSTSGASLRLVILDACRNNPLARSMQRTAATRTVSGGSFADLNEDLLGDETLVAYAAAAGTTAADGRGRNSPYTAALLSHLDTPLEIGLLFRRVRAQVLAATNGAQRPHEYHSLVGEHYLTRTLATGASVTVSAAAAVDPAPADPPRPTPEVDITELHISALRELAEAGDAAAQAELGERYEHGRDVVQDHAVAVSWFRRAFVVLAVPSVVLADGRVALVVGSTASRLKQLKVCGCVLSPHEEVDVGDRVKPRCMTSWSYNAVARARETATPPRPGCPVFPGAVLSDQGVGQQEKLVHGGARRVEPTDLAPVQRPATER